MNEENECLMTLLYTSYKENDQKEKKSIINYYC